MFRGVNSDGLCSKEAAAPAVPAAVGVAAFGQGGQESPWFGLLSAVSRPAVYFLQKCLPERLRSPASLGGLFGGFTEDLTRSVDAELAFVRPLHDRTGFSGSSAGAPGWFGPDSLRELGIQSVDVEAHVVRGAAPAGYLAAAKNFLSHILSASPQREVGDGWSAESAAPRAQGPWWGEMWGSENGSHSWLSHLSWGPVVQPCGQWARSSAGAVSMPTEPSLQRERWDSMPAESAGPSSHNWQPRDGGARLARPASFLSLERPQPEPHAACARAVSAASTCRSEVAVLTPDQDNGYSSLEEEHSHNRLHAMRPLCLGEGGAEAGGLVEEQARCPDAGLNAAAPPEPGAGRVELGTEESEDSDTDEPGDAEPPSQEKPGAETEVATRALPFLSTPKCQNKVIAYIMGSPCSEESGTESEGDWDSSGDDDDDGFDSEGASEFSDSDDDSDDEVSEADSEADEADAEVERLWSSLCQSGDPYDPRNFTAALCTASKAAPAPVACVLSAGEECPSPPSTPSSPSRSPQSPRLEDESEEETWDVDDAESLRLWNSFNCFSDPYSPLNFQAPLRTQYSAKGQPPSSPCRQVKEAEERMDSGFSEDVSISVRHCAKLKKVRFMEEVEEFYASSDEDRRGPWEEFARDRCRFHRRVQEAEEVISYCLAPTFRLLIFQRLYQSC
ncbi:protein phosphatase 1 regulatory subunit 15B [Arapaima gigas]